MISFFKSLGRGILYVVGLPFLLAFVAIYAVFSFFIIVFMFFKAVVLFFMGRSLFDELEEDKKAKEVLANIANRNQVVAPNYVNNGPVNQSMPQTNNYQPQNNYVSQNNITPPNPQNEQNNQTQNYLDEQPQVDHSYHSNEFDNPLENNNNETIQNYESDASTTIDIKAGEDEDE